MEMEPESPGQPEPTSTPPSGNAAMAPADTSVPPHQSPGPSRQEPASPSPLSPSRREDALLPAPFSPPSGNPALVRRSKRERTAPDDEAVGPTASPQRKRRGARDPRTAAASPGKKNVRRAQRRLGKEEARKEAAAGVEQTRKSQRRKNAARARASKDLVVVEDGEKGSSLVTVPLCQANLISGVNGEWKNGWEDFWEMVADLVMWKNAARSAFWFGSGSMLFMSSSLSRDIYFSPISMCCHFGVAVLGFSFIKDSLFGRQSENVRRFQFTEEDVLHAAQAVLPVANNLISVVQLIFSGEPSMTLKVLPILLLGAKFGHLLTIRRLLALGFFSSFTLPKLYSCYSSQVHAKGKGLKDWILNAWKSCSRKKLAIAIAVTTCWNLISVKTRIMAVFFCMATLRYYYQYCRSNNSSQQETRGRSGEEEAMLIED